MSTPSTAKHRKLPVRANKIQVVAGQIFTGARILQQARLASGWRITAVTDQGRIKFRVPVLADERQGAALATITIEADGSATVRAWGAIQTATTRTLAIPAPYSPGSAVVTIPPPDTPTVRWAIEELPTYQVAPLSASALADACFAQIRHDLHTLPPLHGGLLAARATIPLPSPSSKRASRLGYQRTDAPFACEPAMAFKPTPLRWFLFHQESKIAPGEEISDARMLESRLGLRGSIRIGLSHVRRLVAELFGFKRAPVLAGLPETCIPIACGLAPRASNVRSAAWC